MITLISLTQGNPIALQRTIDSVKSAFGDKLTQVIVGDLCVFDKDKQAIDGMGAMRVELPFNELFLNGFGNTLNKLSNHSFNSLCLYMNVGEIVEANVNHDCISDSWNCYKFNHATDPHQWIRLWNREKLTWSGRIHEEVVGSKRLAPSIIFTMADTPKDSDDAYYSSVMNDVKEMVYFNQYLSLIDKPNERGATNSGWVQYAKDSYQHIKDRLLAKGARYEAFNEGDLQKYLDNCTEFQPHNNSDLIHFQ